MNENICETIKLLIKEIEDIQECIEYSNFELMDSYINLFMTDYTKAYMDIIGLSVNSKVIDSTYWTNITNEIIGAIKLKDVFRIMDVLYFDLKNNLLQLVKND